MQKIYHQGQFDGACFLYCIVNGYSALMKKTIEQSMWEEAMKWIPFRTDYISDIGTQRIDNDFNLYKFTIYRLLREFKDGKRISATEHKAITTIKQMQSLIKSESVLLFNIAGDHWVVAVDYDDRNLQIVCSSQLTEKVAAYCEYESSNFDRKYNLLKRYGKLKWLYQSSLISLCVPSKAQVS